MDEWKVMTEEIKSRCGFCGVGLTTWASRVDHLADHFKAGNTMEHWKGDWGFETKIIDRIDNAMPPCESKSLEFEVIADQYRSYPSRTKLSFTVCRYERTSRYTDERIRID
jgi:hypothetical protein